MKALMRWAAAVLSGAMTIGAGGQGSPGELAPENFEKFRALVKPQAQYEESQYLDELPWAADMGEARKKAAAEGKPLFIFAPDHDPLGRQYGKQGYYTATFFADSENAKVIKARCVPLAAPWEELPKEAKQAWETAHADGKGCHYYEFGAFMTADFKFVGWAHCTHGNVGHFAGEKLVMPAAVLSGWDKLPESERKPKLGTLEKPSPKARIDVPGGGAPLVLKVFTRGLKHNGPGDFSWNAALLEKDGTGHVIDTPRDYLWITAAEAKAMAPPAGAAKGKRMAMPASVMTRIGRFVLYDHYRYGPYWKKEDVRRTEGELVVVEVKETEVRLCLEGRVTIATESGKHAYEGNFLGYLTYDGKGQAFKRFDVATLGEHRWDEPYERNYHEPTLGKLWVGRALELVPPESAFATVPPACFQEEGGGDAKDYFGMP